MTTSIVEVDRDTGVRGNTGLEDDERWGGDGGSGVKVEDRGCGVIINYFIDTQ